MDTLKTSDIQNIYGDAQFEKDKESDIEEDLPENELIGTEHILA